MSYGGGGVGHVIFSLHLGVGHSVLLQLEGVVSKCSGPPPPPPVIFDQSLNGRLENVRDNRKFKNSQRETLERFFYGQQGRENLDLWVPERQITK